MVELKKISVKKRKVSNLNNWEMGGLLGGDSGLSTCPMSMITCEENCTTNTGYYCISSALTSPCETYPKC